MTEKVLIAMSGGVDSSVAAYLLKQQGYTCIGCTMKLYDNEDTGIPKSHTCCSLSDVEDARSVAYRLGMPYYVFNYKHAFREKVIAHFINEYRCGRTPNPCIDCNRYMKFELLYQKAEMLGCDYIATGHYASILQQNGEYSLHTASDVSKDQSYVLYQLSQKQLAHTLFPLGNLSKTQVREIAAENGFLNAHKPDSQDICFVPDGNYAAAIERFSGEKQPRGNFVDQNGTVLGKPNGISHYTVGQRKGLGVSSDAPLYVLKICADTNTVVLGRNEELFRKDMTVRDLHWISQSDVKGDFRCQAKIRYKSPACPCTVSVIENRAEVLFDEPVRAVTPGQSAVFYEGTIVLGGGLIEK